MDILILSSSSKGGAGIASNRLYSKLLTTDHTITFITKENMFDPKKKRTFFSIMYSARLYIRKIFNYTQVLLGTFHFGYLDLSLMSTPYDREVVENSSNYDLVNIHWVQNGFLSLRAIQKIVERRPTIITMHDEWFLLPGGHFSIPSSSFPVLKLLRIIATIPTSRLILRRKNHILSLASGIIVPSMWLKSRCLEFGLTAHKVHWIPNLPGENLDLNRTLRPTEEIKIGFVSHGRLFQKQKNFRELYIACQLLRKNGYPIKILVAGATRYPKKIPNWITLEVYEENQMKNFYSQIDLLVLCSKIDNLPQVGIEAQKFGKFLIAKNSGGSAETIANSESGISYTGGQDELANTIKDIIDNNINLHNNALISMSAHQKWDSDLLLDSHLEVFNLAKNKRNI